MTIIKKIEVVEKDVKVKKYYFLGILYLVKEKSYVERKTTLFGICISRHNLVGNITVNTLNLSSLFNQKKDAVNKAIDIVIPVYNGYEYLDNLFASIQQNTDLPYRLFVVNDCSTDERVVPLLDKWQKMFDSNMTVIHHETNGGFVKSVNTGLQKTTRDVVLINTDVIVPKKWASRLLYPIFTDDKVGSVTPFSNAATIFSIPKINDNNDFSEDLEVINVSLSRLNIPYQKMLFPTGVGFCMAMSRKAIDKIGFLDEIYDRGYGEENDWCQHAIKAGFYNTIAGDLFVWHKHGGSFMSEEKIALIKQHAQILIKRFPRYDADVQKVIHDDTFLSLRFFAELFYLSALNKETQVWFDHSLGGGTEVYTRRQFQILQQDALLIRLQNDGSDFIKMTYCHRDLSNQIILKMVDAMTLLGYLPIGLIVVNNLAGYNSIPNALLHITDLKKKTGARVSFRGHDLQCICPAINMMNADDKYCNYNHLETCERCFASIRDSLTVKTKVDSIREWNIAWRNFFEETVDEVIVFSESTRDIYAKYYPITQKKVTIIPHKVPVLREVTIPPHQGINIIVLGNISISKGYLILEGMVNLLKNYPGVSITVVGKTYKESQSIVTTGAYQIDELPDIMEQYAADIIFIPSVWPETFSYTTSEAMSMNMPLACFNLGAPAERVCKYHKGLIISKINAQTALTEIVEFVSKTREMPSSSDL